MLMGPGPCDRSEAARFVWRRAGDEVQASRDTLAAWSLARALFIKDTAGFFRMAAKIDASAAVRGMVKAAVGAVRARLMRDVGEAFSTIALDALATRTGLDAGSATKAAVAAGWEVDGKVVRIPPSAAAAGADAEAAMSLRSLHTLTSYVASLERPALVGDAESDVAAFVAAAAAGGGRRGGAGSGSAGASAQMA